MKNLCDPFWLGQGWLMIPLTIGAQDCASELVLALSVVPNLPTSSSVVRYDTYQYHFVGVHWATGKRLAVCQMAQLRNQLRDLRGGWVQCPNRGLRDRFGLRRNILEPEPTVLFPVRPIGISSCLFNWAWGLKVRWTSWNCLAISPENKQRSKLFVSPCHRVEVIRIQN